MLRIVNAKPFSKITLYVMCGIIDYDISTIGVKLWPRSRSRQWKIVDYNGPRPLPIDSVCLPHARQYFEGFVQWSNRIMGMYCALK